MTAVQESLLDALIQPKTPRVFTHVGCGGWVLFRVDGGHCLTCQAGPLHVGDYQKPEPAG